MRAVGVLGAVLGTAARQIACAEVFTGIPKLPPLRAQAVIARQLTGRIYCLLVLSTQTLSSFSSLCLFSNTVLSGLSFFLILNICAWRVREEIQVRWECPGIPAIPTSAIPTLQVLPVQPQVTHDVLFGTFWPRAQRSGESSNSQFFQCSTSFEHSSDRRKGNIQSLSLSSSQCCFQMPVSDSQ